MGKIIISSQQGQYHSPIHLTTSTSTFPSTHQSTGPGTTHSSTYLRGLGAEVTLGTGRREPEEEEDGGGMSKPSSLSTPSRLVLMRSVPRLTVMRSVVGRSGRDVGPEAAAVGSELVAPRFPFFSEPLVKSMSSVVAVFRRALSLLFRESSETSEVAEVSIRL